MGRKEESCYMNTFNSGKANKYGTNPMHGVAEPLINFDGVIWLGDLNYRI